MKKPEIIQSQIWNWIPACLLLGILTITFDSIIQLAKNMHFTTMFIFERLEGQIMPAIRA